MRARTQPALSREERTNLEATAPPAHAWTFNSLTFVIFIDGCCLPLLIGWVTRRHVMLP